MNRNQNSMFVEKYTGKCILQNVTSAENIKRHWFLIKNNLYYYKFKLHIIIFFGVNFYTRI